MTQELTLGMTDDELRRFALEEQRLHDPDNQTDNPYERCELCHYTRHPCSTHDLASAVLQLLDRGRDGTMESDAD